MACGGSFVPPASGCSLAAHRRKAMQDKGGDDDYGDGHEHITRGTEALCDLRPLSAQLVADQGDGCAPDGAAGKCRHAEAHEAHLRETGGNRYEGAHDGQDAPQEDRRLAAPCGTSALSLSRSEFVSRT